MNKMIRRAAPRRIRRRPRMTKPFFKRSGDATIYYNYSEWPSRSCNFRKSFGKPRPFLHSSKSSDGRRQPIYFVGTRGKKKKIPKNKKKRREATEERKREKKRDRDEEQKVGRDEGRGGGKINAPSGIAHGKLQVWRAWRATTGLARWSNSLGGERKTEMPVPAYKKRVTMQKALHPVTRRARFRSESLASDRQTAIDNIWRDVCLFLFLSLCLFPLLFDSTLLAIFASAIAQNLSHTESSSGREEEGHLSHPSRTRERTPREGGALIKLVFCQPVIRLRSNDS